MKALSQSKLDRILSLDPNYPVDIWTVQENCSWFTEQFVDGYFTASWNHKESFQNNFEGFPHAYNWLRKELSNRIEGYSGDAPIWAWLVKPNIREYMRRLWVEQKPDWILVHARVPLKRMLLSCYDMWHSPLNNAPIIPIKEWDDNELFYNNQENIEATWHRVFDFNYTPWMVEEAGCSRRVQVCADRIYLNEVQSIKRIVGRKLV